MIKNRNGKTYINVVLFNRKMMENRMNFSNIMDVLQVNRPTALTKMYGSVAWRNVEIARIAKTMDLTMKEIYEIFIKGNVRDWKPADLVDDFKGDETGGDSDEICEQ
uniref:hypothetical protein n=1 Tax=Coprococcus catus TaxID=116085 RepID=UPI0022E21B5B|nr:hypothetical protein [Coprococcus catus]